jgi:hypothetical protein
MLAEVGLFLTGVGTTLILMALIALIWSMVPRDQPQEAVERDHPLPPTVPGTSSLNDPD